ncbi:MAG: biopolymer transporter ExbD [Thermoanaerobaculaceae bacterium]|nr:biopolymer transporter ExbD [Thermoanaerobaculaceae bacterium]TAM47392.1 MAG: biopolymer transporter ExbD [Acidobacteriota bacterium]
MQSARRHADHSKLTAIGSGDVKSDINVTPLVDVCLVLLIIFMVVTPLLQSGVPVLLPETNNPDKYPEGQKQVKVAIQEDGKMFIGQDWIPTRAELIRRMDEMLKADPQKEVVIKADRRLKYKDVREVMKALNDAGFSKVGLITMKKGAS